MNFNIYNILIIAGTIQGFIFTGVVCLNKKFHAKSTFFLVALIFVYSLSNLIYIFPEIGIFPYLTMYNYLFIPIASIIPTLIYFYVMCFLFPSKKITLSEKLLFSPFLIIFLFVLWFRFRVIFGYDLVSQLNENYRTVVIFNELFSVIFSLIILILILLEVHIYENKNKAFDKKVIRHDIKWLKTTLITILVSTFYWSYLAIKNIFITKGEVNFYYLWVIVAALIYWLGHIGIYNYGVLEERKKIRDYSNRENTSISSKSHSKNHHIIDFENFITKEKAYLDSTLTLESVAENLKISSSYLSRIIHSELDTSFTDYIHSFRIKEAQTYLSNPEFWNYTIVSIGLEAGFNSRSTFFNVFKKETGETPLQYKKNHINSN